MDNIEMKVSNEVCLFENWVVRTWVPEEDYLKFCNLLKDKGFQKFGLDNQEPSLSECKTILAKVRARYHKDGLGVYGVFSKTSNELIGTAGLYHIKDSEMIEISLRLAEKFQGKKVGYALAREVTKYGINKLGLKKIHAVIDPQNIPSINLFKKLGYKEDGIIKYCGNDMKLFHLENI